MTNMTNDRERELVIELGKLRSEYTLSDKSEENIERSKRIKEIMAELNIGSKHRADRRKPVVNFNKR